MTFSNYTHPKNIFFRVLYLFLFLIFTAIPHHGEAAGLQKDCPQLKNVFAENKNTPCIWCTQIYFSPTEQILISSKNNTILLRNTGDKDFTKASLDLSSTIASPNLSYPHAIVFNPTDGLYYLNDTDNNRILTFHSLTQGRVKRVITQIAGIDLIRPHDIIYDPASDWLYTINPAKPVIFRFNHTRREESFLDLSHVLSYSRSLSLVNGKIYVAGSSHGKIVEILDFEKGTFNIYQSASKKRVAYFGNWHTTGLIINDIDYYQGYWYASSYFAPSAPERGRDYNKNKLIRFQTWQEFLTGKWQDLSDQIPDGLVPYYLTIAEDGLYIALLNHERPGQGGTIYRLSTQCP